MGIKITYNKIRGEMKIEEGSRVPEGNKSRRVDQLPVTWGRTGREYFARVNVAPIILPKSLPFILIHSPSGSNLQPPICSSSFLTCTKTLQFLLATT